MFNFQEDKTCHHSIYNAVCSRLYLYIQELCIYSPFGGDPANTSNLKV